MITNIAKRSSHNAVSGPEGPNKLRNTHGSNQSVRKIGETLD